ncbi:MAG: hypothetical protein FWD56_07015, partial [Bacteroidales bacterium]|nr:hypothetical protein [Bacteroidales bacterium]
LLYEGSILESGSAEDLANNPEVRRKYLGQNFELRKAILPPTSDSPGTPNPSVSSPPPASPSAPEPTATPATDKDIFSYSQEAQEKERLG